MVVVARAPIYHPFAIYLIYHLVGFIVRPFTIYRNSGSFLWDRIGVIPHASHIVWSGIIALIALASCFLGFLAINGVKKTIKPIEPAELSIKYINRFYVAAVILVCLGAYATYKTLFGAGLSSVLAYETAVDTQGGQALVGISGYITALAEFLPVVCIVMFMSPQTRKISIALIIVFVATRFYAGAQRLSFIVVLAALFFYSLTMKKRRFPSMKVVLILLTALIVFDVIGNDRYAFRRISEGESNVSSIIDSYMANRSDNFLTSDIVEFDVATSVVQVTDDYSGFTFGTQYLRLFIWPIPRQLWQDKPVYTSTVNLNDYGDFRYLTTSLYGDLYMVFGLPSLIAMMFILGMFMSMIYKKWASSESALKFMFFWIFLIYIKTIFRDGGVTVVYFWGFSMVAVSTLVYAGKVTICRNR